MSVSDLVLTASSSVILFTKLILMLFNLVNSICSFLFLSWQLSTSQASTAATTHNMADNATNKITCGFFIEIILIPPKIYKQL